MSKRLVIGGIIGCKYKPSSWHLNEFPDGSNIFGSTVKNQNAPRPSEHPPVSQAEKMSKHLGGIKGCKYKTSSWHINGFPDGNNIGSTVCIYVWSSHTAEYGSTG